VKNAELEVAAVGIEVARRAPGRLADYLALTKPRLNGLVVASSAAGYHLGAPDGTPLVAMAQAVAGTALVAGGAAVLNQLYERDTDALMIRTRLRPLPDQRVSGDEARLLGVALALSGIALLAFSANALAALLAAATLVIYVAIYTPLKRRSTIATLVGAVPGALPPLIGWTASHDAVAAGGAALFAIVFLWQIPHFMAIAWLYREDYRRAGFPMLPVVEPDGYRTGRQAAAYAAALVPVSLMPTFAGVAGLTYFWAAFALGAIQLWLALRFASQRTDASARVLFYATITYLPLLWAVMVLDHS
jgi:protoheme IX farnesyltransferase